MLHKRIDSVQDKSVHSLSPRFTHLVLRIVALEKKQADERQEWPKVIDARCIELLNEIRDLRVCKFCLCCLLSCSLPNFITLTLAVIQKQFEAEKLVRDERGMCWRVYGLS